MWVWFVLVLIPVAVVSFTAGRYFTVLQVPRIVAQMNDRELSALGGKVHDLRQG
jgi:hypothetical protein